MSSKGAGGRCAGGKRLSSLKGGLGPPSLRELEVLAHAAPRTLGHLGGTKISDFEMYGLFRFCLLTKG